MCLFRSGLVKIGELGLHFTGNVPTSSKPVRGDGGCRVWGSRQDLRSGTRENGNSHTGARGSLSTLGDSCATSKLPNFPRAMCGEPAENSLDLYPTRS
jgi:hypothetical protein